MYRENSQPANAMRRNTKKKDEEGAEKAAASVETIDTRRGRRDVMRLGKKEKKETKHCSNTSVLVVREHEEGGIEEYAEANRPNRLRTSENNKREKRIKQTADLLNLIEEGGTKKRHREERERESIGDKMNAKRRMQWRRKQLETEAQTKEKKTKHTTNAKAQ